jgi:hypothetical protein
VCKSPAKRARPSRNEHGGLRPIKRLCGHTLLNLQIGGARYTKLP